MSRKGSSKTVGRAGPMNPAEAKTRTLALVAAIDELSRTGKGVTTDTLSNFLEYPRTTIAEWLINLVRDGLVARTAEKRGTVHLTSQGKEVADNLYIIRSGNRLMVGERVG